MRVVTVRRLEDRTNDANTRRTAGVPTRYTLYLLIYLEIGMKMGEHVRHDARHTSSNGLVSLKQLSQTSFTARSADALSGQLGLAMTDNTARLRTHAYGDR